MFIYIRLGWNFIKFSCSLMNTFFVSVSKVLNENFFSKKWDEWCGFQCTLKDVNIVRNLIGFHRMELFVKTGAFWEEMINTKNFEFFLKFVILGFLKLRSPKRSPQNCQNIGDYLKNLKISCFLDLQLWISFETSFSSFELKKKTMCAFRHT